MNLRRNRSFLARCQMFPEAELLDAVVDLVKFWHWASVTYVYEDDVGAGRLGQLLANALLQDVRIQVS